MAKPGPKGKAAAQKRARGTAQKCREEAKTNVVKLDIVKDVDDMPDAPEWFRDLEDEWPTRKYKVALQTFDKICGQLFASQVLSAVHVDALAVLAAQQAEVSEGYRSGKVSAAMITQLRTLYSEFGLTPASQKAVASGGSKAPANKFATNGNRARS